MKPWFLFGLYFGTILLDITPYYDIAPYDRIAAGTGEKAPQMRAFFARKSGLPLILTLIDAYGSAKAIPALFERCAAIRSVLKNDT